jgi:hypothetical protein
MNRRGFLQGLFAAATAPLVPDVLRPTLLDTLKAGTIRVASYIATGNERLVTEMHGHFSDAIFQRDGRTYVRVGGK